MFIELMIEHHIGGVDMAKAALELSDDERVVDAARRTVTVQQAEIESLENHLERIRSSVEE
jgi:uncharacterized protein (DUF305 family)